MVRDLRHDRSPLLYPAPSYGPAVKREERCMAILELRAARAAYHLMVRFGSTSDTAAEQARWKLRQLGAGLGYRLVIAGTSEGPHGTSPAN